LRNCFFSNGCFPACFKHAAIPPILKKPTLETSDLSSYRPISNLDFISKILERLFLARFQPHVPFKFQPPPACLPSMSLYRNFFTFNTRHHLPCVMILVPRPCLYLWILVKPLTPLIMSPSSTIFVPVSASLVLFSLGSSLICLTEPSQCALAITPQL